MLRGYRKFVLAGILSSCILSARNVACAEPTLKVGDVAPAIECLDSDGKTWNSRDLIGKQMLVVYFYPCDFSFCCTRQAIRYQERLGELKEAGVAVVGVSCDPARTHQLFKSTNRLGFTLLADVRGEVARQFGVPLRVGGKALVKDATGQEVRDQNGRALYLERKFTAERWTYFIDSEGRIAHITTSASPRHDSNDSLQFALQMANK